MASIMPSKNVFGADNQQERLKKFKIQNQNPKLQCQIKNFEF